MSACSIENVPAGDYTLTVTLAGYAVHVTGTMTITDGITTPVGASLVGLGSLKISVTDGTDPIAGAHVVLDTTELYCDTGADGVCTISDVEVGDYTLTVTKEGFVDLTTESQTVAFGAETDVAVVLTLIP